VSGDATDGRYASVTPAGCYYATESVVPTPERERLLGLMRGAETPALEALGGADGDSIGALVEAGFVTLRPAPERLPPKSLVELLPSLLPALSELGRVVLSESRQGLFLDYVGVGAEEAEELAALGSRLRKTADRVTGLLAGRLELDSRAFAVVDPAGSSEVGFWPLHIGPNVFTLTVLGIPRFNSPQFRLLVWVLIERYGENRPDPVPSPA